MSGFLVLFVYNSLIKALKIFIESVYKAGKQIYEFYESIPCFFGEFFKSFNIFKHFFCSGIRTNTKRTKNIAKIQNPLVEGL